VFGLEELLWIGVAFVLVVAHRIGSAIGETIWQAICDEIKRRRNR
jgi:hypothetical protein